MTIVIPSTTATISGGDLFVIRKASTGQWEWVTIDGVASGSVTTRDALTYSYATGDTLQSQRLSYSVAATNCDSIYRNARAEWTYEVGGVSRTDTTLYHVSVWAPRLSLTDQDILRRNPRAKDLLGTRQRLTDLIEDVWEHEVLEELAGRHPLPRMLLEHRKFAKLKSTYVDALPLLVERSTGCIHTTLNQTVAATGRLSSSDPNLQNIPVRTEEGQQIRAAFIPRDPANRFLAADYSQIELRILAHLSGDEAMRAAFAAGEDIHARTAAGEPRLECRP
jgi:hypothetical protein